LIGENCKKYLSCADRIYLFTFAKRLRIFKWMSDFAKHFKKLKLTRK